MCDGKKKKLFFIEERKKYRYPLFGFKKTNNDIIQFFLLRGSGSKFPEVDPDLQHCNNTRLIS